jgi:membrane-associated phospholipid phosphatase
MKRLHSIWKLNRVFYIPYGVLLLISLILLAFIQKGDVVLWINDYHSKGLDQFFRLWTKTGEEWPFYIAILGLLFYQVRYALYVPFLGAAVALLSFLLKTFFSRPRPSRYFTDQGVFEELNQVDLVTLFSGHTSFPSGHTMAAFTIFTYLALCVKSRWIKIIFLVIAILAGISRMYLLQHFLEDVSLGSLCGVAIGTSMFYLQEYLRKNDSKLGLPIHQLFKAGNRA